MEQEQWQLCGAVASVVRAGRGIEITVRGVVTAPAYEELHSRMARETARVTLRFDDAALLAVTVRSAAEAATRRTICRSGRVLIISARPWRLAWAVRHCALLRLHGMASVGVVLEPSAEPVEC